MCDDGDCEVSGAAIMDFRCYFCDTPVWGREIHLVRIKSIPQEEGWFTVCVGCLGNPGIDWMMMVKE